jgi:hypothetical protein
MVSNSEAEFWLLVARIGRAIYLAQEREGFGEDATAERAEMQRLLWQAQRMIQEAIRLN